MGIFLSVLGLIFAIIGIILIFDARKIAKEKWKGKNVNSIVIKMKIIGFILEMIGWLLLYFGLSL